MFIRGVRAYAISPKNFSASTKDFGTYHICANPTDKHQPSTKDLGTYRICANPSDKHKPVASEYPNDPQKKYQLGTVSKNILLV